MFDQDESGTISANELKMMLGGSFSEETITKIIQEVDKDGSGDIDFIEFKEMLTKIF